MNKMSGETVDLTTKNIDKLKELFPEIISEGDKIDFDKLKTIMGNAIDDHKERYNFTWHGKKESMLGAQKPSKGTLRPDKEKSKNFDTTENLYIEGDNLETLKLLQKSYNNKVKVIYIDPPYNTGNDFVYKDNFKEGIDNYLEQTGQVDSEGNQLSTNSESQGRYHSNWLNMMYQRLKLARNLLTDDGVIFISIDDNEVENMKKITSEIFGENNVEIYIWNTRVQGDLPKTAKNTVRKEHEYIITAFKKTKKLTRYKDYKYKDKENVWNNLDNDPRGVWMSANISRGTSASSGGKNSYEITNPVGIVFDRDWSISEEEYNVLLSDNRIYFSNEGKGVPRKKIFTTDLIGSTQSSIFENLSNSQHASRNNEELLDLKTIEYPKPIELIERLITIGSSKKDDIIIDFFSGSATTAHATMKLNAKDEGNRKFIMVQLPEPLDKKSEAYKNGYHTICDIGEERIRRAGEKVKKDLIEKNNKEGLLEENQVDPNSLDIGFKVFKLDKSNIREWNVDFDHLDQLDLYEDIFVEGRSELDVVYEILLKNGIELTYPISTFEVDGKRVYDIACGNLFICFSDKIDTSVAKAIADKRNEYAIETSSVVFKDAGFAGNDSEKLNVIEILKDADYTDDQLLTI